MQLITAMVRLAIKLHSFSGIKVGIIVCVGQLKNVLHLKLPVSKY